MKTLGTNSLRDTILWKRLNARWKKTHDKTVAKFLSANVEVICEEASSRMKAFPSLHPQYTLHDHTHLIRVTELMGRLIPPEVLNQTLNPIEIALLILVAHMHDQGMVLSSQQLRALENTPSFQLFRSNWATDHPNLIEIKQRSLDNRIPPQERDKCKEMEHELEAAMLTEYIRINHGQFSEDFVRDTYGNDKRLEVSGTSITALVGKICRSHTSDINNINPKNGFNFDEEIANYSINVVYLSLILRLADVLDFDRERTPDALFRTIHFTSPVSLREWSHHRAVDGWTIKPDLIRFTVQCDRPEYHRTVLHFMDWIDRELQETNNAIRQAPTPFSPYKLSLPTKVERDRIQAKNNAYIYHDLEFSLSRDELIKLLMGKELYRSPSLCIRELIQNSLDALRHRKATLKRDSQSEWNEGKVELLHTTDSRGREVIQCRDNGMGMDEDIIKRFLVRAGRSYYRSAEFEQERISLAASGVDFDPCSRFGIGFMSCFMLGDYIRIETRRLSSFNGGAGKPLIIEINGVNGLVVFRTGDSNQRIGTTVEITGRLKPTFFDEWTDQVKLVDTAKAFILASEFPVVAECKIPETIGRIEIFPNNTHPKHPIEIEGINKRIHFSQDFSEIDPRLNGSVITDLLINENGDLVLENDEAAWIPGTTNHDTYLKKSNGEKIELHSFYRTKTCIDGILICGAQGPDMDERLHIGTSYPNWISTGNDFFVLDIRGSIKPEITPARGPAGDSIGLGGFRNRPTWGRVQELVNKAHGRLWRKILQHYSESKFANPLWQLASIHSADLSKMHAGAIWDTLKIPAIDEQNHLIWRQLSEIDDIPAGSSSNEPFLRSESGILLQGDVELNQWHDRNNHSIFPLILRHVVIGMSTVEITANKLYFQLHPPQNTESIPHERFESEIFTTPRALLPFQKHLHSILFAEGPIALFNEKHPLATLVWSSRFEENLNALSKFACSLIYAFCDKDTVKEIAKGISTPVNQPRTLKRLGHMFSSLDWSQIPTEFHPPYSYWTVDYGFRNISADDFRNWAPPPAVITN